MSVRKQNAETEKAMSGKAAARAKRTPKAVYFCNLCPNCGTSNELEARKCTACRKAMP